MKALLFLITMVFGFGASGAPQALTYQGRVVSADGKPLQYSNVSFQFEITTPNGACVLYREQVNGVNMTNSNGVFDVKIGSSHSYPASASFTISDSFNNSSPMTCDGGAIYNPTISDGRLLRVQFHDGTAWRLISPDAIIRSVPYAAYASSSNKLGSYLPTDFILKTEINGGASCGGGSFLTWNAATQTFGCAADSGGGGGSGTVTDVTSANSYLTVANSTTTPIFTLNVGTTANTVAAGNDARLSNARIPTGAAGGDLGGTYPNPSVAKIQGVGVDFAAAPTTGQVLTFDGTNWIADSLPAGASGTVTSITAGTGLTGGSITSSGTIGLGAALSGLNAVATNGYIQRTGAGIYGTTTGNTGASNNTLVLRDGSGVSSFYGVGISGATSGAVTFQAPLISGTYSLTLPDAQGAANQVMANDGNGILSWVNVPAAPGAACGAGNVLTYNGTAFTCVPDQVGSAGGGIATLNSQTGSSQSFATGTTGTAPHWSSGADVHTLNVPFARNSGVTGGLISKTEYDTFNSKQVALGFTPLAPGNNLSELTDAAAARANLGLGSAALKTAPASGNAAVGEVVLGDDTRLTNSRAPSGTAGGDLGGSYPNPDVNRLKGVGLSITSLTTGDFLKYNGTNWINAAIGISDITGLTTALNGKIDQSQISGTCSADKTLTFSSVTGTWTCTSIVIAGSQVSYGTQTAKTFFAAPTGATGAPSFRTIASTDLPASITDAAWTAASGDVYRSSGKVGIGTASPEKALHVKADNQLGGAMFERTSADTAAPMIVLRKSRAGAAVQSGDALGLLFVSPNKDGTNYEDMVALSITAAENYNATSAGTNLNLYTTAKTTLAEQIRMTIDDIGYVGIGTTMPKYKLDVSGTTFTGSSLFLERFENAGSGPGLDFRTSRGPEGQVASQTLAGQEIAQLNFYGTDETGAQPSRAVASIRAFAEENTTAASMGGGILFRTTAVGSTSLSEKMRITSTGTFAIGTTTPETNTKLQTAINETGTGYLLTDSSAPAGKLTLQEGTSGAGQFAPSMLGRIVGSNRFMGLYSEIDPTEDTGATPVLQFAARREGGAVISTRPLFSFKNHTTPLVTVAANGHVGIGTSDPQTYLDIYTGATNNAQGLVLSQGGTNSGRLYFATGTPAESNAIVRIDDSLRFTTGATPGSNSGTARLAINDTGNVGIGTTAPSYKLHVAGTVAGSGAYVNTSDQRLKDNIQPLSHGLDTILELNGVSFTWRREEYPQFNFEPGRDIGVIAQEVEKVLPEAVVTSDDGFKSVAYSKLIAPLIEAVKELYQKINTQSQNVQRAMASANEKMNSLQQENQALKARNQQLEAYLCAKDPAAPFCER